MIAPFIMSPLIGSCRRLITVPSYPEMSKQISTASSKLIMFSNVVGLIP